MQLLEVLTTPTVYYPLLGAVLLGIASSVAGCFVYLRKQSLVGDAVAHAVLPGVCMAFMITGDKGLPALFAGAVMSSWVAVWLIGYVRRISKLKDDSIISIVLSVFFGAGTLMLTAIQHSDNANQSGLDKFLMGSAAAILPSDVLLFAGVTSLVLLCVMFFFKEFVVFSFDESYAASLGVNVRLTSLIIMTLVVMAVVSGIQAAGVVMMAALLIAPAATARYWTDSLRSMIIISCVVSAFAAMSGVLLSALLPSVPAGAAIVLCGAFLFFVSMLVAPRRGMLARIVRNRRYAQTMLDENILKAMYHAAELVSARGKDLPQEFVFTDDDIATRRIVSPQKFIRGLRRLQHEGYVLRTGAGWVMTPEGKRRGARITRLHRLWEVYLSKHLNIAADHVHDDAESVEHIITPDIEQRLQEFLDYPERDPHEKSIPY